MQIRDVGPRVEDSRVDAAVDPVVHDGKPVQAPERGNPRALPALDRTEPQFAVSPIDFE